MPVPIISFFSSLKNGCYNKNMMNYDSKNNRTTGECCGRPMVYAKPCECTYNNDCLSECHGCSLGRIKKDADPCKSCCVIPAITVDTVDGITNLANCFVHVTSINTTFYIDDKHRPMIIWSGPVEVDAPTEIESDDFIDFVKSFNLRSQFLYVKFRNNETPARNVVDSFYFDRTGKLYFAGEFEEVVED